MEYVKNHHFYINLKKRYNKKILCEKELKKIGINEPNRFNAIENKIGIIGCVLSHIKCIEFAKNNNWDYVCIFEDDVIFIDTDKVKLMINKYIDYEYDVLYIGARIVNNRYSNINNDLIKIKKAFCFHAYIVKKHYYDILLNNFYKGLELKKKNPNPHCYNFDNYCSILQEHDKWLCFNPILATQRDGYSDNFNKEINYEKTIPIIPLQNEKLPYISILTPTFNRKKFLEMMIHNLKNFNYPKEKIEWCILDSYGINGDISEKLLDDKDIILIENQLDIVISYTYLENKMSIGEKRNWLCENAKHDILINMDDDDIYFNCYLKHSINTLIYGDKDIVGSKDMIFIFPYFDNEICFHQCIDSYKLIHEATICMKKSFWKKNKYINVSECEGQGLFQNEEQYKIDYLNIFECMLCVCWKENTIPKYNFHTKNKLNLKLQGAFLSILKKIFNKYNMENIDDENTNINKVEINIELLKDIRKLIEVVNDRIKWKSNELLPVGLMIKQIDELLKDNNIEEK